jgi:DNA topoisomerase-1
MTQPSAIPVIRSGDDTPATDAREAGLRYVSDQSPGIRRRRAGRGFAYHDSDGRLVRDRSTLARIRALAIPPAWTEVWICPTPNGHLQAVGRDARGRKQYRYHARWRRRRDGRKFDRIVAFARALPRIRRRCDRDIARRGLPREKVLGAIVRLLELTLIRVGNDEYAKLNRSFGLTTLRDRHAQVSGTTVRFRFRGKSGRQQEATLADRRLATIVKRCQELPGQELFQYVDSGGDVRGVRSEDVNAYLEEIGGEPFTAKDFRTWAGSVLAFRALRAVDPTDPESASKRAVAAAMRQTADGLGNTPPVARRSYVHPAIIEAFLEGSIGSSLAATVEDAGDLPAPATSREAAALVDLLRRGLEADARR